MRDILLFSRSCRLAPLAICICLGYALSNPLFSHPISLSMTFIDVYEDVIEVETAIYLEDLALFYWSDEDPSFSQSAEDYQRRAIKHADFLLKHIHLLDENGKRLEGEVERIDTSYLDGVGSIGFDELMEYTLQYKFVYPVEQIPQYLSIMQDFGGENPAIPSEMKVQIFLHTIQVEQTMLSHRAMHTVDIGAFLDAGIEGEDLETVQARLRERHTEQLGISSYSKVYNYIYINERAIRHELLIPLLQLDDWLSLTETRGRILEVADQKALQEPIRNFIKRHQRVEIDDGQVLTLTDFDIRFFGPGVRDLATLDDAEAVTVHNARVGIIAEYAIDKPAGEVSFYWGYYTGLYPFFEGWLYPYDEPREGFSLHNSQTPLRWQDPDWSQRINFLPIAPPQPIPHWSVPLIACAFLALALGLLTVTWRSSSSSCTQRIYVLMAVLCLVMAWSVRDFALWQPANPLQPKPDPEDEMVNELTSNLLHNIYQAFSFSNEEAVYDALAESVGGPLLRTLYLDIHRSIINREQGGAIARIHEVKLSDAVLREAGSSDGWPALQIEGEWTVLGSVEHWGHVHIRKNLHRAIIGLVASDNGWRVRSFEPLTEERIEESVGVRR